MYIINVQKQHEARLDEPSQEVLGKKKRPLAEPWKLKGRTASSKQE